MKDSTLSRISNFSLIMVFLLSLSCMTFLVLCLDQFLEFFKLEKSDTDLVGMIFCIPAIIFVFIYSIVENVIKRHASRHEKETQEGVGKNVCR